MAADLAELLRPSQNRATHVFNLASFDVFYRTALGANKVMVVFRVGQLIVCMRVLEVDLADDASLFQRFEHSIDGHIICSTADFFYYGLGAQGSRRLLENGEDQKPPGRCLVARLP